MGVFSNHWFADYAEKRCVSALVFMSHLWFVCAWKSKLGRSVEENARTHSLCLLTQRRSLKIVR